MIILLSSLTLARVTGGSGDNYYSPDDILELADKENWIPVGKMKKARSHYGLSLVNNFKDFESKCSIRK